MAFHSAHGLRSCEGAENAKPWFSLIDGGLQIVDERERQRVSRERDAGKAEQNQRKGKHP